MIHNMIHNIKLIAFLALITFGAGQAMAGDADLGSIKIGTVTGGGTLTFYKEAACQNQIGIDNNLSSSDLTDGKVYIKATPSFDYTVANMELTAQESTASGNAEARTVTRGGATNPGVGQTIAVSAVSGKPGIYSFTMPANGNNALVSATFAAKPMNTATISYIDADGITKNKDIGTVYILDGTETTLGRDGTDADNDNKPYETWYICSSTLAYNHTLKTLGNVNIIISGSLTIGTANSPVSSQGFNAKNNLCLYGHASATGTNSVKINSSSSAIFSLSGAVTITNCSLDLTSTNYYGVNADKGITITGCAAGTNSVKINSSSSAIFSLSGAVSITNCATVEVTSSGSEGIYAQKDLTITGGQVTVTGANSKDGLISDENIILGWTKASDYIQASSYSIPSGKSVKTADGQRFVAYNMASEGDISATAIVSDTYYTRSSDVDTDDKLKAALAGINGKTLKPLGGYIVTVADGISLMDGTTDKAADFTITTGEGTEAVTTPYYIYKASTEEAPVSVTLSYGGSNFIMLNGVPEGTTLNAVENQPMQRNFAMPAEDVALTTTAVTSFSVSGYYTYSGSAQTPSIKYGDNVIMNADDDFIVTGITKGGTTVTDAIDAGDYSLTIAGVGSYMGTASGIAFSINKKPVYNNSSTLIVDDAIYNGGIVVPEIELKDDNNNVIASSEYTVNIVPYDLFNQGIDYGNSSSIGSVMDVGIYYAVLYGKEESNYDVGVSSAFNVRQKPVGIRWSTDALVYDGTAKAPTASATGVEDVDAGKVSVTVSVDGEHIDAGNYTATASALSGNRASNYKLPTSSETGYATLTNAFAISPKPVTVISTGVTADNKIYDGTTSATLSGSFAFDDGMIIDGDDVTITGGTGAFADKNVGIGKAVVISGVTLGGMDAGNYTLSAQPTGITGSITKKTVTVSGITASNKAYDGKTMATLNYNSTTISGKVTGDKLSVSATGAFADKNAGNNKTVNISNITLTGSDKGNYTLATTGATTTANISKKALTVTADDKSVSYGDAAPTYTASYSGFVSGESKSNLSGSLSFTCSYTSSSNTGDYTITPSGLTSSNYSITFKEGTLTVEASIVESESGTTVTLDENGYSVTVSEGNGSGGVINIPDGGSSINVASLTYNRTLDAPTESNKDVTIDGQAAKLYTTCLPTVPTTNTNVKYYKLASVSNNTLNFTEEISPAANTPYLMAVTGSNDIPEQVTGSSVTLKKTMTGSSANGYTMMGTQTGLTNSEASSAAGIADNATYILQPQSKWGKVTNKAGVYIPPFRAFIVGPATSAGARELNSSFDGETVGIDTLRLTDADGTEHWYDLNGRRIDKPTRKGIYIRNGKMTTTNYTN